MAISENRVDISSITKSIKSIGEGLLSTGTSTIVDKAKNAAEVPQNITDKLLGLFNENMCNTPNYKLDLDSLFDSLNRDIKFGSLDVCGNRISANPFDGSLINGFNSIKSNLLNSLTKLSKMPKSFLDSINNGVTGTLSKYKIPTDCVNGFSLSNQYNLNLSGLDKDLLKNGGKLCSNKKSSISNYTAMNAIASNRDALYKYTSEMSEKDLMDTFGGFLSTRKDMNINNKVDAISNKLVVNSVDGGSNTLMVNSKVKEDLFNSPDDMLNVKVDSSNIINNMDLVYKDKIHEVVTGEHKNNKVINSSATNNGSNIYGNKNGINGNISGSINSNDLEYVRDVNAINQSNNVIIGNNPLKGSNNSFKGYSDGVSIKEYSDDTSNRNITLDELNIDLNGDRPHIKNYTSEHDRYFKVRHVFDMVDKTWNKDEDNNVSYHKLKKSNSFKMMTTAMVHTRQPMLELSTNIPPRELTDFESIYILSNI